MMKFGFLSAVLLVTGMTLAGQPSAQWELAAKGVGELTVYKTDYYKRGFLVPLADNHPAAVNLFPEEEVKEHLHAVKVPTLEFFSNRNEANPTEALPVILVAPGGGYSCLAYRKEGVEIARQLMGMNCHVAVLKYPINCEGARDLALQSAQQALAILKDHADELNIDPKKVGMMGFSAGAHLTARVLAQANHPLAFGILIYPAYLSDDGVNLKPDVIPAQPLVPTFIMQCRDDRWFVNSSLGYAAYLTKANAPVSYHLYSRGGHGFGGRLTPDQEAVLWHTELHHWFGGLFTAPASKRPPDENRPGYKKAFSTSCGR